MKKLISTILSIACVTSSIASCNGGGASDTESTTSTPLEYNIVSALEDNNFEQGFNLRGLSSATDSGVVKVINYGDETLNPKWDLAQWWSKNRLENGEETITDDVYTLKDESKKVEVRRNIGAITLELNATNEFECSNIAPPPQWPHLLLEQSVTKDFPLKNAEKITAELDFTMTKADNNRIDNIGMHSQFAWFIYVVDRNPDSEGFGNFLWFGLNIYNSLSIYAPGTAQQDTAGGLGNFIYTVGAKEFLDKQVKVNRNTKINFDILPHIETALTTAQSSGFMMGTTVQDCSITGMNIGYEIFDRWDNSITIFDMDIKGYYKKN